MADSKAVLKVLLYLSVIINFILFVCFIVLQFQKTNDGTNNGGNGWKEEESVCFSCDYLGKDIKKEDTLYSEIITTSCGQRVCCIQNKTMQNLISQMISTKEADNWDVSNQIKWWRRRQNSAHLFIRPQSSKGSKVQWAVGDKYGLSFTNGVVLSTIH